MSRTRRGTWVAAGAAGLLLVIAVLVSRPAATGIELDPRSTSPTGTAAMVALVDRLGATVAITGTVATASGDPSDQTIVVLADRMDEPTRAAVRRRVEAGARLVVFDPTSALNAVGGSRQSFTGMFGGLGLPPACDLLDGVVTEVVSARWQPLTPGAAATARCFPLEDGFGLVTKSVGSGEVVVTSAVDALINRNIQDASHARLAAALLVPRAAGTVTVVWDATPGGGDTSLLDLLPDRIVAMLWVLGMATVLAGLARGRRLGRPVAERLAVRVPASELALSIGELLARYGHREAAASRLRADLRREVATALHLPVDTPPDVLVEVAVHQDGQIDAPTLRTALLDGSVPDDASLVTVATAMGRVRAALGGQPADRLRRDAPGAEGEHGG